MARVAKSNKLIQITLPKYLVEAMDEIVENLNKIIPEEEPRMNRSKFIAVALADLLDKGSLAVATKKEVN